MIGIVPVERVLEIGREIVHGLAETPLDVRMIKTFGEGFALGNEMSVRGRGKSKASNTGRARDTGGALDGHSGRVDWWVS